jgi:hypothetical protein
VDAETFVVDLAPYAVTAVGIVVAGIWGNSALKAKNEVLKVKDEVVAAKDEQLKAVAAAKDEQILTVKTALAETIRIKDTHIQMLEQFRPTSLLEQLRAFITWNEELSTQLTKSRGEVEASAAAAKAGSAELESMKRRVGRLSDQLERAESSKKVAEELAEGLRRLTSGGGVLSYLVNSIALTPGLDIGRGVIGAPYTVDVDALVRAVTTPAPITNIVSPGAVLGANPQTQKPAELRVEEMKKAAQKTQKKTPPPGAAEKDKQEPA